ncbi:MAG TPA: hypothetical protein VF222_08915 [Nitrososphaeraceae archaeon]
MGKIAKKGRLFLGKRIGPKSARRARKPLSIDWITGNIPNRHYVNKRRNRKIISRKNNLS